MKRKKYKIGSSDIYLNLSSKDSSDMISKWELGSVMKRFGIPCSKDNNSIYEIYPWLKNRNGDKYG